MPTKLIVSVTEAQEIVNRSMSAGDIRAAQFIIEFAVNRDFEADAFSSRNQRWLKRAIAYQAAWMEEHPEVFTSMDVASLSQVDFSVGFRNNPNSQFLAPLARACMKRLSWMGSRSVSIKSSLQAGAVTDDDLAWRPI